MEKLIKLLKDYIENYGNDAKVREEENYILDTGIEFVYGSRVYLYETIISKKFGFIQWLVENEKIDRDEIIINSDFMPVAFNRKGEKYEWSEEKQLLMLLSIQDNPIEFLCSILK